MACVHVMCALEIVGHESIKVIDIFGTNAMQLNNVIIVTPELND